MLIIYLICLIVGGVLVGMSVFLGGDHDADHDMDLAIDADIDADFDADVDVDADADADGEAEHGHDGWADGVGNWLPLASLRFWTFFLAFGGLLGTLLSAFDLLGTIPTAVTSVVVGYVCGLIVATAVRKLRKEEVDSTLKGNDCLGASAEVLLPVGKENIGKVRVRVKDRLVDFTAETEDDTELPVGDEVFVYEVRDDGVLLVTAAPKG